MIYAVRINYAVKKSGSKTLKFSEGRGDVMQLRSAVGGLSVSIGPGLPKDAGTISHFVVLQLILCRDVNEARRYENEARPYLRG